MTEKPEKKSKATGPIFTPYSAVQRPGHYDHIPESIRPNYEEDPGLHHPLQRSSSSFLSDLETPPSTPSEEEAGTAACHFLCFGKKPHHVDYKLSKAKVADKFGIKVLTVVIISLLPAFIVQVIYVFVDAFRVMLVLHYTATLITFVCLFLFNLLLKYFSGLARHPPFHVIMIVTRSIVFAIQYTLLGACIEFLDIWARISINNHDALITAEEGSGVKGITWKELYKFYLTDEFEAGSKLAEAISRDSSSEDASVVRNIMLLFGITFAIFLLLLLLTLVKFTKMHFFGPIFPFISYTLALLLILTCTTLILGEFVGVTTSQNVVWELLQSSMGPLIGSGITELFVVFLEDLLNGRLCPIKVDEYLYGAAHY